MTCTWFHWQHHKGMKTMKTMKTSITLPYARRLLVRSQQWSSEAKDCFALGWEEDKPCLIPKPGACLAQCWLCSVCVYIYIYMCVSHQVLAWCFHLHYSNPQKAKIVDQTPWDYKDTYADICRYMQYYTPCCKKTADPKPPQSAVSCCSSSSPYFLMSTRKQDFSSLWVVLGGLSEGYLPHAACCRNEWDDHNDDHRSTFTVVTVVFNRCALCHHT